MHKFIFSLIFSIICSFAIAQSKPIVHEVAKGETLYSISKKYHITVEAIEKANKTLGADFKLKIGQKLNIPTTSAGEPGTKSDKSSVNTQAAKIPKTESIPVKPNPTISASGSSLHIVAKGETVYAIAKANGLTWKQIKEANHLSDDMKLKLGQKLIIPSKNPDALYKTNSTEGRPDLSPKPTPAASTEQGREYKNTETAPIKDPTKSKETIPAIIGEVPKSAPADLKQDKQKDTSKDENPFLPKPAESDKPANTETKLAPIETAKPKAVASTMLNEDVPASDYPSVFDKYNDSGRRKVVYRGIGTFMQNDNPGNQSLALYNYADMGSILKVTNLMSKETIYVKVIGKVPSTDAQKDVILKVSADAASRLKVSEDKFLVEVTGYNME